MCGIAGLIYKKPVGAGLMSGFKLNSALMNHRGPDYSGHYEDDNLSLFHYRLSIIDLEARSNQPFTSSGGNLIAVHNGEIYNYKEIRSNYNLSCRTESDTEVIVEFFDQYRELSVREWNGIFSTVIYSIKDQKLWFIRDRFGVKPLYIYEDENVVAFASEAKVILNWLSKFQINYSTLSQFIWYGNMTGDQSFVSKIRKVRPGTIEMFDLKTKQFCSTTTYWSVNDLEEENNHSKSYVVNSVREKLESAVTRQLVADVPVGVLLSGGIDSSTIVAFASKHYTRSLDTYSVEYDYNIGGKSELPKARMIADKFRTRHHELKVETKDVVEVFKKLVFQYDEPFADPASIPLYQLASACSIDKRVILQGDGGDELFAGYRRYNVMDSYWFWRIASSLYPMIPNNRWHERMKRIHFVLNQKNESDLIAYYMTEEVPYKNPYLILSKETKARLELENWKLDYERAHEMFRDKNRVQELLYMDMTMLLPHRYLEKVDKATMLCSLEARVPFLDNDLADFVLSLPSKMKVKRGQKKYLLKQAMRGIIPDEILFGPKRGFDVPFREWLRKDLYDFAHSVFEEINTPFLDKKALLNILEIHRSRKADYGNLLWKALVLAFWLEIYGDKIEA